MKYLMLTLLLSAMSTPLLAKEAVIDYDKVLLGTELGKSKIVYQMKMAEIKVNELKYMLKTRANIFKQNAPQWTTDKRTQEKFELERLQTFVIEETKKLENALKKNRDDFAKTTRGAFEKVMNRYVKDNRITIIHDAKLAFYYDKRLDISEEISKLLDQELSQSQH